MRKAFKYPLYPTKSQSLALDTMLETHRHLYNRALAERRDAYQQEQRTVRYGEQSAALKEQRVANPYLAMTNFSSCQATLRRLDRAFHAFFRRVKAGEKPGYPRFKGKDRFDTVEFPSHGDGCKLAGDRVYCQHVGSVKVKRHRLTEGAIKTLSFKREAGHWYLIASCDLGDAPAVRSTTRTVGIDLGLKAFLTTSEGEQVAPPKFYRKAQATVRRAQRHLSRCQDGSNRRKKAKQRVARLHQHVAHQRRDWQHKVALRLVARYDLIAHESLTTKGLARTRLAKSIYDAGWTQFLGILTHKAEGAGVTVVAVDARNTTQICSVCGALPLVPLSLRDRVYHCASCSLSLDRDSNAALNIQRLGCSRQSVTSTMVGMG